MQKKILIVIDSLGIGGAEKSLVSLLPFLAVRGYDITLMLMARGGIFEQYVPVGISVVDFPFKPSIIRRLFFSLVLRLPGRKKSHGAEMYWRYLGRHLPELKTVYDVAIAYQQGFPTFYIADKVKATRKFCWINADILKAGYDSGFCRRFYDKYDKVIAVSKGLRNNIVFPKYTENLDKIVVCRDILDESLLRRMSAEGHVGKTAVRYHITTVGRLEAPKGYELAISAAKILKERGLEFVWHFVGGGSLEQKLKQIVTAEGLDDRIIFEGLQSNPYPYMRIADVYVQPSIFEGFGMTVGEAKILGKPVVCTDFTVAKDQITHEKNGLIVEMTGEAIAAGVMRMINDTELRQLIMNNVSSERNTTADTESAKVIKLIEE